MSYLDELKVDAEHASYIGVVSALGSQYLIEEENVNIAGFDVNRMVGVGLVGFGSSLAGQWVNNKFLKDSKWRKMWTDKAGPMWGNYIADGIITGTAMTALLAANYGTDILSFNNVVRSFGYGGAVEIGTSWGVDQIKAKEPGLLPY